MFALGADHAHAGLPSRSRRPHSCHLLSNIAHDTWRAVCERYTFTTASSHDASYAAGINRQNGSMPTAYRRRLCTGKRGVYR